MRRASAGTRAKVIPARLIVLALAVIVGYGLLSHWYRMHWVIDAGFRILPMALASAAGHMIGDRRRAARAKRTGP